MDTKSFVQPTNIYTLVNPEGIEDDTLEMDRLKNTPLRDSSFRDICEVNYSIHHQFSFEEMVLYITSTCNFKSKNVEKEVSYKSPIDPREVALAARETVLSASVDFNSTGRIQAMISNNVNHILNEMMQCHFVVPMNTETPLQFGQLIYNGTPIAIIESIVQKSSRAIHIECYPKNIFDQIVGDGQITVHLGLNEENLMLGVVDSITESDKTGILYISLKKSLENVIDEISYPISFKNNKSDNEAAFYQECLDYLNSKKQQIQTVDTEEIEDFLEDFFG
ncbi:hypothetical protein [Kurthia sp. Dielmo]|uniref:hypothetical protein n=1 Tax=Kurthia sp. Dielmo TaxID=1033738 RepID=UPI00111F18E6|nr:hypothetical protein [Kurthia sp. Dielmo]